MTLGQWLGQWQGEWLGALEPQAPGSIAGTATLQLAGAGIPTGKAWAAGSAALVVGGSGTLSAESGDPIVAPISGTATLSLTATGRFRTELEPLVQATLSGLYASGSGNGYVWKDNSWVQSEKVSRSFIETPSGEQTACVQVVGGTTYLRLVSSQAQVSVRASSTGATVLTQVKTPTVTQKAYNKTEAKSTVQTISGYNGSCETIGIDEILVALGMAA